MNPKLPMAPAAAAVPEARECLVGVAYSRLRDGLFELRLKLAEPWQTTELELRGRDCRDVPAWVARAAAPGDAAPVLAACSAVEAAIGVTVEEPQRQLRRLLLCGEWIRNHTRHIYFWHSQRLLGYPDLRSMTRDYPELVERALRLHRLGALLQRVVGGCRVQSTTLCIGGFSELPSTLRLQSLAAELEWALDAARDTAKLVGRLPFPRWNRDYAWLVVADDSYLSLGTQLCLGEAPPAPPAAVAAELAKPRLLPVYTGALARFARRRTQLPPVARVQAQELGLDGAVPSPFRSLALRALEMVAAVEEALTLIRGYRMPPASRLPVRVRRGSGHGCAESAAGLCLQSYRLDAAGRVLSARIQSPAGLSQPALERDLRDHLAQRSARDEADLLLECRQLLGSFDTGLADRLQLSAPQAQSR